MMATMQSDALADEIEAQLGHYDVYYRFSVDRGLDSPGAISLDNLGAISTHTRAYLQQAKIQRDIESCVLASEKRSGVTVADISKLSLSSAYNTEQTSQLGRDLTPIHTQTWNMDKRSSRLSCMASRHCLLPS